MKTGRTPFIDHLRIFLTVMVILVHTAITYGAFGGWYWQEVSAGGTSVAVYLLNLFNAVNQSYFMGFFFLLSGYYLPAAYDRKGAKQFLLDRLLRLGVPLILFVYIVGPIASWLIAVHNGREPLVAAEHIYRTGRLYPGPLWFAQALLLFSIGYILWRKLVPFRLSAPLALPTNRVLFGFAILTGIGSFLLRLPVPLGADILGMTIGFFSSYIVLFIAGCLAAQERLLEQVTLEYARPWMILSGVCIPILPVVLIMTGDGGFTGGWNAKAALFAFWEPFVALGIILGMLAIVRDRWNHEYRWTKWLTERTYTVYIVHTPILVGISLLFHSLILPTLCKFLVVGGLSVIASYAIAGFVLTIPGARKIL